MIVALAGGVGGAKLALGLAHVLAPGKLTAVVNTADDFEHLGLHVSPDLDTMMYTLAGLENPDTGWGRRDETWGFMDALQALGGETWFRLGDRDLATHIARTRRLAQGETLSAVTASLSAALGVRHAIVPMSDDPVRTSWRPAKVISSSSTISCASVASRRSAPSASRAQTARTRRRRPWRRSTIPRWRLLSSVPPIRS